MLSVTNTDCLQLMSDALVNATNQFVEPSAKDYIPSWIYDLPEDQQQAKIDMIHAYGSPNVFASFQPHVTLVADAVHVAPALERFTQQPRLSQPPAPVEHRNRAFPLIEEPAEPCKLLRSVQERESH